MKKNDRPHWAIVIKYEGETVYTSGGKRLVSDLNHVLILPKGCSYDWECTKSGHFSIIEFECDQTYHEPLSFSVKHGEKVLRLFKDLEYKRNLRGPMFEAESIHDTYSIILSLASSTLDKYVPDSKREKIEPAIAYISQNFDKPITNDSEGRSSREWADRIYLLPNEHLNEARPPSAKGHLSVFLILYLSFLYFSIFIFHIDAH